MKKKRLIPVLLLKNGYLVQSKSFSQYRNLGNPTTSVKRMSTWASDELIYLDISVDSSYDMRRDDLGNPNRDNFLDIVEDVAKVAFMPITVGGKIRTIKDIEMRLKSGADKVSINTSALENPKFILEAAKEFGSQCIVVSVDVKLTSDKYKVMSNGGKLATNLAPGEWAHQIEDMGGGEILLNSVDRDGMKNGFDIELINLVTDSIQIPVIACGGAGEWEHFEEVLTKTNADAVAAANIFQHIDQSVFLAKQYLFAQNLNVRPPSLLL